MKESKSKVAKFIKTAFVDYDTLKKRAQVRKKMSGQKLNFQG